MLLARKNEIISQNKAAYQYLLIVEVKQYSSQILISSVGFSDFPKKRKVAF